MTAEAYEDKMYEKYRQIFHEGKQTNKKVDESNELRYSTLCWLLRDFEDPNDRANLMRIL